jgi:hypothetical protein
MQDHKILPSMNSLPERYWGKIEGKGRKKRMWDTEDQNRGRDLGTSGSGL